jgi:hypothetical protein
MRAETLICASAILEEIKTEIAGSRDLMLAACPGDGQGEADHSEPASLARDGARPSARKTTTQKGHCQSVAGPPERMQATCNKLDTVPDYLRPRRTIMAGDDDGDALPPLASGRWTPIAFRPQLASSRVTLSWIPIDGAPIDAETAHQLRVFGKIFMANRHTREFVELVVRRAPSSEEARPAGRHAVDNEGGPAP